MPPQLNPVPGAPPVISSGARAPLPSAGRVVPLTGSHSSELKTRSAFLRSLLAHSEILFAVCLAGSLCPPRRRGQPPGPRPRRRRRSPPRSVLPHPPGLDAPEAAVHWGAYHRGYGPARARSVRQGPSGPGFVSAVRPGSPCPGRPSLRDDGGSRAVRAARGAAPGAPAVVGVAQSRVARRPSALPRIPLCRGRRARPFAGGAHAEYPPSLRCRREYPLVRPEEKHRKCQKRPARAPRSSAVRAKGINSASAIPLPSAFRASPALSSPALVRLTQGTARRAHASSTVLPARRSPRRSGRSCGIGAPSRPRWSTSCASAGSPCRWPGTTASPPQGRCSCWCGNSEPSSHCAYLKRLLLPFGGIPRSFPTERSRFRWPLWRTFLTLSISPGQGDRGGLCERRSEGGAAAQFASQDGAVLKVEGKHLTPSHSIAPPTNPDILQRKQLTVQ